MRAINEFASPPCYFSAKHANVIAVQLDRIDYVKREKEQADTSKIKDNVIDHKCQMTSRGRRWLRKQVQNCEGENGIQSKENPNSDEPRPEFVAAKISVPRLFSGKARSSGRLLHLPLLKANAKIPPLKWRQLKGSKRKVCLDPFRIRTKIEARFEHEEDRKHERDQAQHFSWPDADAGKKGQRFFGCPVLRNQSNRENDERSATD